MFNEGEEFSVEEIRTATGIGYISINGYCRISVSCTSRFTWSFLSHRSQRMESSGVRCSPWPAEKPVSLIRTPVGKMLRMETGSISTMNLSTSCSALRSIKSKWRKRYGHLCVFHLFPPIFFFQVFLCGSGLDPKKWPKLSNTKFYSLQQKNNSKNESYLNWWIICFSF